MDNFSLTRKVGKLKVRSLPDIRGMSTEEMTITIAQPAPAKNGKSALLSLDGGAWVERFLPGKSTPFRPNSFDEGTDAPRVTCSISAEGDLAEWAQLADEQIIAVVSANSALYMKGDERRCDPRGVLPALPHQREIRSEC